MPNIMEEHNVTQRSADKIWLDSLVLHLQRLEYCENMARCGCENIIDYSFSAGGGGTKSLIDFTSKIQLKNAQLFLNEAKVLYSKSKPLLSSDQQEIIKKNIYNAEELLNEGIETYRTNREQGVYRKYPKHVDSREEYVALTSRFGKALEYLYTIREEFITGLWKYLDPSTSGEEKP